MTHHGLDWTGLHCTSQHVPTVVIEPASLDVKETKLLLVEQMLEVRRRMLEGMQQTLGLEHPDTLKQMQDMAYYIERMSQDYPGVRMASALRNLLSSVMHLSTRALLPNKNMLIHGCL